MEEKVLEAINHIKSKVKTKIPIKISCHTYKKPQLPTLI